MSFLIASPKLRIILNFAKSYLVLYPLNSIVVLPFSGFCFLFISYSFIILGLSILSKISIDSDSFEETLKIIMPEIVFCHFSVVSVWFFNVFLSKEWVKLAFSLSYVVVRKYFLTYNLDIFAVVLLMSHCNFHGTAIWNGHSYSLFSLLLPLFDERVSSMTKDEYGFTETFLYSLLN